MTENEFVVFYVAVITVIIVACDVTSPRGDGSCPAMTGLCSRVDGGNGIDTVKAMITDISLNFISLCLSFGVQNTIGRKRKF